MNAVAQWLTETGAAPAAYRVSQGTRVGRDAGIAVTAEDDGTVWIGGDTAVLIRGPARRGARGGQVLSRVFMMTKLLTVATPGRDASRVAWKSS